MKTLAIPLHTGKSQQILNPNEGGLATALADSLSVAGAAAITHFTTPLQVQLPLQAQLLLPQEQLLLPQEPLPRPWPLPPWRPPLLLAWPPLHPPWRAPPWRAQPSGVSWGCRGTPPAHRPRWQRQKHHNPHNISPRCTLVVEARSSGSPSLWHSLS